MEDLTAEEVRVINLLTEGYTYKEIATKINRPFRWVGCTITRLKRKNKCRSSVQLIAVILRDTYE